MIKSILLTLILCLLGGRVKSFNRSITTKSDVREDTPYQISISYKEWLVRQSFSLVALRAMNKYDKRWKLSSTLFIENLQLTLPWQVIIPLIPPPVKPLTLAEQLSSSERWIKPLSHYIQHDRTANLLLPLLGALQLDFQFGSTYLGPGVGNNGATLARLKEMI